MLRSELLKLLESEEGSFGWIKQQRLIAEMVFCGKCGRGYETTLCRGFQRGCMGRVDGKKCESTISIFKGSLFYRRNIGYRKVLSILYEWCESTPIENVARQVQVSKTCVSKWYTKFSKIAAFDQVLTGDGVIGGQGVVVEVDESCFVRNKYNKGRTLSYQKWAVGAVERGNSKKCFIEFVQRRDRETLLEVIARRIKPGSIIQTDEWRGYRDLDQILVEQGYTHVTVNHSENFVDPETRGNTQTIESLWSVTKRGIRRRGTYHGDMNGLKRKICEILFMRIYKERIFERMVELLACLTLSG